MPDIWPTTQTENQPHDRTKNGSKFAYKFNFLSVLTTASFHCKKMLGDFFVFIYLRYCDTFFLLLWYRMQLHSKVIFSLSFSQHLELWLRTTEKKRFSIVSCFGFFFLNLRFQIKITIINGTIS